MLELFIGAAELMAQYNGIKRATHIREKITQLINYEETVRALTRASAYECRVVDPGIAVPDTTITNIAKYYFASHYHQAVSWLQDIAGGLLVTGPAEEDWHSPETRPYIQRYLGGAKGITTENRLKLFNLIRDIAASDFGGYQEILSIHAEGSLEAQKITIYREFDMKPCVEFVKKVANINDER
jgi:aromatic ring hydroxylase